MLENINQSQFEQVLNLLIFYKQMNPKKNVNLSEQSFKDANNFFKSKNCIPDYPKN